MFPPPSPAPAADVQESTHLGHRSTLTMPAPISRQSTDSRAHTPATQPSGLRRSIGPALVGVALATVWVAPGAPLAARLTLTVFVAAIVAWTATDLDDTLIALGAAAAATLVSAGGDMTEFHASLGSATVWLLIASFVIAAAVQASGLATIVVSAMLRRATTVSSLFWRITGAIGLLTFAIPATSGRAALALPVFVALHGQFHDARIRRGLALLFPSVILLSASASLLGAGAHLVAMDLVGAAGGEELGFVRWAVLAVPFTALSCAAGTTAILHLFLDAELRRRPIDGPATAPVMASSSTVSMRRVAIVMAVVLTAWCTTSLHGLEPSLVAVLGAVAVCAPGRGGMRIGDAIDGVPWSLVLFLAATTALGAALLSSGAADWLGGSALRHVQHLPTAVVVTGVVATSLLAHLVIGSRSARASVLVPLVIVLATASGLDLTALVFASSIAAGYCLTLTISAKPVAMFQRPFGRDGEHAYRAADLLRLSAVLVPVHLVLLVVFSLVIWPGLGLSL